MGAPATRTYALVVSPQLTNTAVRIRIDRAEKLQPEELLSKAETTSKAHTQFV